MTIDAQREVEAFLKYAGPRMDYILNSSGMVKEGGIPTGLINAAKRAGNFLWSATGGVLTDMARGFGLYPKYVGKTVKHVPGLKTVGRGMEGIGEVTSKIDRVPSLLRTGEKVDKTIPGKNGGPDVVKPVREISKGDQAIQFTGNVAGYLGGAAAMSSLFGEGSWPKKVYDTVNEYFPYTPIGAVLNFGTDAIQNYFNPKNPTNGQVIASARKAVDTNSLVQKVKSIPSALASVPEKVEDFVTGKVLDSLDYFFTDGNFDAAKWQAFAAKYPNKAPFYWRKISALVSKGSTGTLAGMINALYKQPFLPNFLIHDYLAPWLTEQTVDKLVAQYKTYYPEYYKDPEREKELREQLTATIKEESEKGIDFSKSMDSESAAKTLGLIGGLWSATGANSKGEGGNTASFNPEGRTLDLGGAGVGNGRGNGIMALNGMFRNNGRDLGNWRYGASYNEPWYMINTRPDLGMGMG